MSKTRLAVLLATVGGLGYSPFAPGTVGSAAGVGVYLLTRGWPIGGQWALLAVVTLVGVWASTETARHFAREDPGPVVIDEVAGQLMTFIGIAHSTGGPIGGIGILSGFLVFRLLDIVKPWPANRFERLPGGVGIMADDIMAGVYGNLLMRAFTVAVPVLVHGDAVTLRTAEIIAVGSELLSPHRSDTNSLFLAGRLNDCGVALLSKCVMPDDRDRLREQVTLSLSRSDVVMLTGGLGPTSDDVTREAVAAALSLELDEDPNLIVALEERFRARGVGMAAINRRQAQVPRGAVVLKNDRGTAPGLWIDAGDRVVVLLPGPPRELQPMVDGLVMPRLRERTSGRQVRRRVIKITGRAESAVDELAQPIYSTFAGAVPIETSILAAPGQIELHLSTAGEDIAALDAALDAGVSRLADALGQPVFSVDGRSLEEVVGTMLLTRGLHIAAAESCTGGLVLGKLTEVPGSSGWVIGGVIAYDNDVKIQQLGVPGGMLAEHGAVSEPVAMAMATGVRERLGADVGVAITGIAGPTGGSEAKPVGTVVIAVAAAETVVRTYRFLGDRQMVRQFSVAAALDLVRRTL